MMRVTLKTTRIGDRLESWCDTGALGPQLCYFDVVRIGDKRLLVRDEQGSEAWRAPEFFTNNESERQRAIAGSNAAYDFAEKLRTTDSASAAKEKGNAS